MPIDWHSSHGGRWEFVRVKMTGGDFVETGAIAGITGASISKSRTTTLKMSGSIDYGILPELGTQELVRVYYIATQGSNEERIAVATGYLNTSSYTIHGGRDIGTMDLYSTLRLPSVDTLSHTLSYAKNTAIKTAVNTLLSGYGVPIIWLDSTTAKLTTQRTYTVGTDGGESSVLEVVNDLLSVAGFESLDVDAYGRYIVRRYRQNSTTTYAAMFSDVTDGCIPFQPDVDYEFDDFEVPNRVTVVCSNPDSEPMIATVTNDSPSSRYSTYSRGYVISTIETVSDIESQSALTTYAQRRLESLSSAVESITLKHAFTNEFSLGDNVRVEYSLAGRDLIMTAVSQSIDCGPAGMTTTRLRRFITA